jgi:DNA repair protein SbcC/Rad50
MRPIRLSLQAFGPFATTEVVDFRSALETGLFGIYGQTGAGKSTLFSAMSFALFGAPTKTDQEPRSLRSDHAASNLPTEVEFVFELGAKTYLIRRRPAQERPKARGEGTTEDAAEASLFDVTGIPVDSLGPSQSGRVIAEKKVSLVGQQVEALLGYGADQFRQIVLLPQGKFETFLAAKTDARVEILRDLFDVKIYRDLAARLKEEASEAERALRDQRALYVARLEERGFESAEALELGIAAAETKVEEKQAIQNGAAMATEAARQALTEGEQVEKAFSAVDTAQQAFDDLEKKTGEVDELAKRIEAVRNALQVRDLETAWRDAEQESRNAVEAVTKAEAELNIAAGAQEVAEKKLVEAKSGEERRQKVQADLTRLEAIENQVGQAADLRSAFDAAAKDEGLAKKALTEAIDAREKLKSQRDATDLALDQARKTETVRGQLTGELAEVNRERVKAAAHVKAQEAVADAQRNVEAASNELATRTDAAQAADAALVDAEARLSRTIYQLFGHLFATELAERRHKSRPANLAVECPGSPPMLERKALSGALQAMLEWHLGRQRGFSCRHCWKGQRSHNIWICIGANVSIASAVTGPTPGIVCARRTKSAFLAADLIFASSSATRAFISSICSRYIRPSSRTSMCSIVSLSASASTSCLRWAGPRAATSPCSARWPRKALII